MSGRLRALCQVRGYVVMGIFVCSKYSFVLFVVMVTAGTIWLRVT